MLYPNIYPGTLRPVANKVKPQFMIQDWLSFVERMDQQLIPGLAEYFILVITTSKEYGNHKMIEAGPYREIYCLYPGQILFRNDDWVDGGLAILFKSEFLCPLRDEINSLLNSGLFNMYSPTLISINAEKAQELDRLACCMLKEFENTAEMQKEIQHALLKLFIIHLIRINEKRQTNEYSASADVYLVNQFLDLVNRHFADWKKVTDYADKLCIVPNYLNVKVKKVTGLTASYHIQQRIILEAKRKARQEYKTLKEIAYTLGFEDISHFSKFFKKFAGVSFSDFKKMPA